MDVYTDLLLTVLPIVGIVIFLLSFGWALGIHTRCRDAIEQRLFQIRTKRAIKEARRAPMQISPDAGLMRRLLHGLRDHLMLRWQRQLGGDDAYIRRLGILNDAILLILPLAEIICILGSRIPLCAWIALGIVALELPIWFVVSIFCLRMHKLPQRQRSPYEKISVPAYVLRDGYPLAAVVCLATEHCALAGMVLLAETAHLAIACHAHTDHFYCMMQNVHHRPMTPQHHSEPFKRTAEKDAKVYIVCNLVLAGGCFLLALLQQFLSN